MKECVGLQLGRTSTQKMFFIFLYVLTSAAAFECPGNGNFPDSTSCDKYFQCADGQATSKVCPDGQSYSRISRKCDQSEIVPCSDKSRRSVNSGKYKIVCYFTNWAGYRNDEAAKFIPSQIDPNLCTHINYAFASLSEDTKNVHIDDLGLEEGYFKELTELKKQNPNLKLMLSLGGYTDSNNRTKYANLVSSKKARKTFNANAVDFLAKYKFDGLDLDWEYPGCTQGTCEDDTEDKENFATWVKELRADFDKQNPKLELSAAVSSVAYYIDVGYDVPALASALDHINVMAYDFSNSGDEVTGQNAPLKAGPGMDSSLTAEAAMKYWQDKGAPASKLVLGFPAYGVSYTLKIPRKHGFGAPAKGPGKGGPYTQSEGNLGYFEICKYLNNGWKKSRDENAGPFAYSGNQWVGYDDPKAVAEKAQFVIEQGYAGLMVWDITTDDFNGDCCDVKFPLMNVANNVLNGNGVPLSSVECQ